MENCRMWRGIQFFRKDSFGRCAASNRYTVQETGHSHVDFKRIFGRFMCKSLSSHADSWSKSWVICIIRFFKGSFRKNWYVSCIWVSLFFLVRVPWSNVLWTDLKRSLLWIVNCAEIIASSSDQIVCTLIKENVMRMEFPRTVLYLKKEPNTFHTFMDCKIMIFFWCIESFSSISDSYKWWTSWTTDLYVQSFLFA
jgi:hypothetical protein